MSAAFVASAAELETVPDGTVISWLRIPGDHTSEAVAFVRQEIEQRPCAWSPADGRPINFAETRVTWISPGGWDPMSVEDAGVTFPATVIRWGEVTISEQPSPGIDHLFSGVLDHGGTWSRETALRAAVELFSAPDATMWVLPRNGEGPNLAPLLQVAEDFQAWLDRDVLAEALNATVSAGLVNEDQAHKAFASWLDRDRAADGEPTSIILDDDTDKGTR
ncbi:hypothetical protein PHELEMICH_57 [Mycobacterium phage Phelemich]|uniref:Uncharacterized protein n=2 Tax=Acadianvirus reprobate TaxID=1982903 RepID=S5Z913_9CAUD|nr:hypothetical protein N847_gp57 [Mycobacterium phage Phelemich]YP_008409979.1 hypothetical protein REPROBATE_58 [Mycobacterium phage Reprobate]AGT12794.1 hypothetical protein REPROBATE_58 [Mycobacterium phage Reprobate]AGT13971.1 hypothetical protein PHELEMICH_57 [Mycobacterium phage Phelemich]